ncbi:MAG TPA: DUF4163 domain-containing protein [Sphingomicrobium sp.]|jgi:hypothetical protein|nr:DUF4163 domain-containing protein [Sphingomicrobium sp.]
MKAAIPFALFLAACGKQVPQTAQETAAMQPAPKAAAPTAKPFVYDEENDLIDYHFGWSAQAAAVPQLVARFQAAMTKDKAELLANAKADKSERDKEGFPFNAYMSSTEYETAGQSGRLLSLRADIGTYTGGAHGNSGTKGLLWDRSAAKEVEFADLFAAAANMDRLLTQPWCDALNKAREEKRGEPVGGGGMFDECPQLGEVSVIPTDKDGNGKFERLLLVADPYVAGPYVEGSYEIELPVTGDLTAAISSDFRESFEVQPQ